MTAEQSKRFDELGCLPRSLLKLCELAGKPKTKQEFCDEFAQSFIDQTENYGRLTVSGFLKVCQSLPIPPLKGVHGDYAVIRQHLDAGHRILMRSGINLDPGKTDVIDHCSVILRVGDADFLIWTPVQDGSNRELPLLKSDWVDKQCTGIIFF